MRGKLIHAKYVFRRNYASNLNNFVHFQSLTLISIITTAYTISGMCVELISCKGKGNVGSVHAMKAYGGVLEVHLHPLARTQDGGKCLVPLSPGGKCLQYLLSKLGRTQVWMLWRKDTSALHTGCCTKNSGHLPTFISG